MAPPNFSRPTLRDVAQAAGVSHMTVSRVVQGSPLVSEKTVRKVRLAIEALQYKPDPALSALAAYRNGREAPVHHGTLAFLDCDGTEYGRHVFEGASREAALFGYEVERFELLPGNENGRSLSRMLFHRGVRGLLFGPSDTSRTFEGWDWKEFAPVSLGALEHKPDMHAVAMDYFQGAFSGCRRLKAAGCKRVGLVVNSNLEARTGHRWLGGYAAALDEGEPLLTFRRNGWSVAALTAWVREKEIDGVLSIHGSVWDSLRSLGVQLHFVNDNDPAPGVPRLVLNPATIGAEGVRFLHNLLLRREFGLPREARLLSLHGEWMEG